MALEATIENLVNDLRKLCMILGDLDVNAGDTPATDSARLADDASEFVTEVFGLAQGCLSAAEEAQRSASRPFDPNQLRRSLAESQKQFHSLTRNLFSNLLAYERVSLLVQLGRERKRWLGWVNSVRQGLEKCRPAIEAVEDDYLGCWQEIAERVTTGPVAVHTTNIGQQITAEALASHEATHEGIT